MYVTDIRWCKAYPMKQESAVHETLDNLIHQYGVWEILISNNAKTLTQWNFTKMAKQAKCTMEMMDPYSLWQNSAEVEIQEGKKLTRQALIAVKAPRQFWDSALELHTLIRSHTASNHFKLNGQVLESVMRGEMVDISWLAQFKWYDFVQYHIIP